MAGGQSRDVCDFWLIIDFDDVVGETSPGNQTNQNTFARFQYVQVSTPYSLYEHQHEESHRPNQAGSATMYIKIMANATS